MSNTSPAQVPDSAIAVEDAAGQRLSYPVMAPDSQLVLIKANTEITPGLVKHLQKFGVQYISPPEPERKAVAAETAPIPLVRSEALFGLPASAVANLATILDEGVFERDVTKLRDMMLTVGRKMLDPDYREFYAASLGDIMQNLGVKLIEAMTSQKISGRSTLILVKNYFEALNGDWSPGVKMLDLYTRHTRLADHCVKLTVLSMALADHLGFSRREVKDVGALSLMGKLGLMKLAQELLTSSNAPTRFEQIEIMKAPQYSTMLLEQLIGLPQKISAVANQLCERGDGSGYPRGLSLRNTSPLARIVSLSDCYLSLVASKPFRPAVQPNAACVFLLQKAAAGVFERRSVAALIELIGCYPSGAAVELSNGEPAVVIAPSSRPGRPLVELTSSGDQLDLSSVDLTIARTITPPDSPEISDWREIPESVLLELPF